MPEMRADTHVGLRMRRQHFCSILNEVGVSTKFQCASPVSDFLISFTDSRNCYIQTGRQCEENKRICAIIYNKPTRCNSGSIVFINNYKYALVVVNKHKSARVASCWFILYYRLVMHGNSNILKKKCKVL